MAAGVPLQPAGSADADHGWWYKANVGVGLAPPAPPNASQNGIYVAGGGFDAIAIGAVRVKGVTGGTLRLEIATLSGTVAVVVCPITSVWRAAQGGVWTERPSYDCQRGSSRGTVSDDGTAVSFTVPRVLDFDADNVYELALLPDPVDPAPFELALQPPGPGAFTGSPGSGQPREEPSGPASPPTSSPGGPAGGPPPSEYVVPQVGGAGPALPSAYVAPEAPPAAGPLTEGGEAPDAIAVSRRPTFPEGTSRAERLLVACLLSAVAGGLWLLAHRNRYGQPSADGVVGMEGGIGRFMRPRQQPPVRL